MDTYAVDINEVVACRKLLDGSLLISQTVVTQIAVTVVVIPLRAIWVTTSITYCDDDKSSLSQAVGTGAHTGEGVVCSLYVRTGLAVVDDGVELR